MAHQNFHRPVNSLRKKALCFGLAFFLVLTIHIDTALSDITEIAKITPADGGYGDLFGSSVSISGDYLIVGAPNHNEGMISNNGCAYIFERSNNTWSEVAKLLAPDISANDTFGASVSISGDYAIVGSPFDTHTGSFYGSAYIFHREETSPGIFSWEYQDKLVAGDGGASDYFGTSVSISGDYAIVGAPFDDDKGADSGSAYIFQRSGVSWTQVAKLVGEDDTAGDHFGQSVSISGDDAFVGAPRHDFDEEDEGAFYAFHRSDAAWTSAFGAQNDPNGAAGDEFGWSVSVDGDFALAGAHFYDNGVNNSGSARIFEEITPDTGLWYTNSSEHWLMPSDAAASDEFGFSVSVSGEKAVIGTLRYMTGTGTAYVFRQDTDEDDWQELEKLVASDGSPGVSPWGFGSAVAISGRYAVIGARHDLNTFGSAYVYDLLADPTPPFSGALPGVTILLLDD
jgi:hypothetical protein